MSYNSYTIPNRRYLDELYFNMREYFLFEEDFTSNLPKNYISTHVICLVDAEDIENWKSLNSYESCLNFLENNDKVNFDNYQSEILNQNKIGNKDYIKKFNTYETLDEVCHDLKKGKRISIIGHQFLCYMNKITYTKKCFKCYTKNNQLIIYFGNGKSIFIPKFFPDKILDSENVFIVDLSGDKACLIEAIFDNNKKYQNMFESIKSIGSVNNSLEKTKMSMTNLLSYNVDKNELKNFKNYNFYLKKKEKNNSYYEKENLEQKNNNENYTYDNNAYIINENNYINKNNNDIIYNYNNNYYINYEENGIKSNIIPNYIYLNNENQYYYNKEKELDEINNNNININEYPRDSNENINININNIYNNNNINQIPEEKELLIEENNSNEIKEKNEQNNYIEIENNQEEQEKEKEKENQQKEESIKYMNTESQNQIDQEKEIFYINDINNKETLLKKSKEENNNYIDTESQNQIDQDKAIFYINYKNNQRTNPELKDLDISSNLSKSVNNNNNINTTPEKDEKNQNEEFNIKKIIKFPTLGLDNTNGKNSYINSTLQCLINTTPLVQFFLSGKNITKIPELNDDINNNNKLLPSFLSILKKLWTNDNTTIKSINPETFINKLKIISSSFNKDEENDIGELIIFLIEQIYSEAKENDEYKNNNVSYIYDIFFGGKKELITECLTCINNNQEKKFLEKKDLYYLMFKLNDVYDFLINNKIKETNKINIYDCLNYYESPKIIEQNGKECDKCGNKEAFLITSNIKKCQNNLLVLLNKNFNNEEKNENIKFELNEIIDMKNYLKENENKEKILYYLYAIICLNISFDENNKNIIHHVAFCKSPVDNMWYKYDDNIVEPINELENEVDKVGMPIALFYQKCEEN